MRLNTLGQMTYMQLGRFLNTRQAHRVAVELSSPEFKAYALITRPLRLAARLTKQ